MLVDTTDVASGSISAPKRNVPNSETLLGYSHGEVLFSEAPAQIGRRLNSSMNFTWPMESDVKCVPANGANEPSAPPAASCETKSIIDGRAGDA